MANLRKSKIWYQNSDINTSISETYLIFPNIRNICPKKCRVWITIFILVEVLLSILILANNFQNIIKRLYGISLITYNINCTFWVKITYYCVFYIKEIKLTLLEL